jgi:hypothetical protein
MSEKKVEVDLIQVCKQLDLCLNIDGLIISSTERTWNTAVINSLDDHRASGHGIWEWVREG